MKIKEFFTKNWKVILIIVLSMLFMSKCATSCSKTQKIKVMNTEISCKDSTIMLYEDSIKFLNIENNNLKKLLDSEQNHTNAFTGIAIGNQKELNATIQRLKTENTKLKKDKQQLEEQLKNCQ